MKPMFFVRRKNRLFPPGRKQKRGVAILTVLAIITLMTILVISFFNMSQTHQTTSKGTVELQRVNSIRDTIINLVIAQIREATTLEGQKAEDFVTWTSQPGAIRTYSATDTGKNKLFKLYSSDEPQLDGINPYDTPGLLSKIGDDLKSDWDLRPDEWVDLNRPVFTAASGSRAVDAKKDQEHFSYPIADPRRWNGNKNDTTINTEGFSYVSTVSNTTMNGVSPNKLQLALPVRWIYILRDGSLGYLSKSGEFTPLTGKESLPTVTNPIVGRMAWWSDDETCKVNVNTASVPFVWDAPRTTSKEDTELMAKRQPLSGEFQRYPGHPATTDIAAVLFPGKRYTPDPLMAPIGGNVMKAMDLEKEAKLLWDIAPYISSEEGTVGGSKNRSEINSTTATVTFQPADHLFTSFDEMYFKALSSSGGSVSVNEPRQNLLGIGKDASKEFLTRLEQSQFFLTHKSHSPETTMHGFPRISMFPMFKSVAAMVNKTTAVSFTDQVSPYDLTIATNSTIGNKAYFFQRQDATSRHQEMYASDERIRNGQIFVYLKELTKLPIPGYPEGKDWAIQGLPTSFAEDPRSLGAKYSIPANPRESSTKPFLSPVSKPGSGGAAAFQMDGSDRTQILLSMIDYNRSINLNPGLAASKYDSGLGQSTGICGCGTPGGDTNATHAAALLNTTETAQNTRTPKGFGRIGVASEISMIVNVAARRDPGGNVNVGDLTGSDSERMLDGNSASIWTDTTQLRYLVEVGFVMSSFTPKMGWSPVWVTGGIGVSAKMGSPVSTSSVTSITTGDHLTTSNKVTSQLPFLVTINDAKNKVPQIYLTSLPDVGAVNPENGPRVMPGTPSRPVGGGLIPAGGLLGPRAAFLDQIAMTRPFVVAVPAQTGLVPIQIQTTPNQADRRLYIYQYDNSRDPGNVTNQIELEVPQSLVAPGLSNNVSGFSVPFNGKSLRSPGYVRPMYNAKTSLTSAAPFPDSKWFVRTWVVPHGDYRIIGGSLRTEPGQFVFGDTQGGAGNSIAHSWWEPTYDLTQRKPNNALYNTITMWDQKVMSHYGSAGDLAAGRGPYLPWGKPDTFTLDLTHKGKASFGIPEFTNTLQNTASQRPNMSQFFGHGRLDGFGVSVNRGSSDPAETGDFDNAVGNMPDGPYLGWPEEGDLRISKSSGYFGSEKDVTTESKNITAQEISPNFLVHSPVDFGSIPSGVSARVPWQTLRFRPDTGMDNKQTWVNSVATTKVPPAGMPFANFCGPKDHFFLDLFWMPVVEPWSISEPFSTKGTINLNQQIFPFMYVERTTGLHALLRGERILAIPNEAVGKYKKDNNGDFTYRHFLNMEETIRQFKLRYEGKSINGLGVTTDNSVAFNTFRSPSEICETWLVPEKNINAYDGAKQWSLEYTMGYMPNPLQGVTEGFWEDHKPTGDNAREKPYSNLYPRVTTRSNVFRIHMVSQALQKAKSTPATNFDSTKDAVTGEWRGSALVERSVDANDKELVALDYLRLNAGNINASLTPRVDRFYIYRVTELKQLTE